MGVTEGEIRGRLWNLELKREPPFSLPGFPECSLRGAEPRKDFYLTMKICEFCSESYKPRKCNFKRQRCCGAKLCRALLKAELQRKYLKEGYWKSDCIRLKQRRYRHKCRILSKNPDSSAIFSCLKSGLNRILDRTIGIAADVVEGIVNEFIECLDDVICGAV